MRKYLLMLLLIGGAVIAKSQNVGIGTSSPNVNSKLDITDTDKGILIPRMDSFHRKNIPNTVGMLVYDSTTKCFWFNNGTKWLNLIATVNSNTGTLITQQGKFLYHKEDNTTPYAQHLLISNYDGSNVTEIIITLPPGTTADFQHVVLSPDGQTVFFNGYESSTSKYHIYSCKIDGSNTTKIVDAGSNTAIVPSAAY